MNDLRRRKVLNLTEQDIRAMLRLPVGTGVLAVASELDPPRIRVLLVNEDWPEAPYDTEAEPVLKHAEVVDGQLVLSFPELREDGDPETPGQHTEYRWEADQAVLEPLPGGVRSPTLTRYKADALALQGRFGGSVSMRLVGDWDLLVPEEQEPPTHWAGGPVCSVNNPNGPGDCVRRRGHTGAHRSQSDGRWS